MFYHSLVSDWNHGNAHFLRGVVTELMSRGHQVSVYEPQEGWSITNLLMEERGRAAIAGFHEAYPHLKSIRYDPWTLELSKALNGADLVLVHEWNEHDLVNRIGQHRARNHGYRLLFHDTHHRSVSDCESMAAYDLRHYDGVLAFGNIVRDLYLSQGWARRAWTWHEAADTRVFHPIHSRKREGDVVWIGNWGDEERAAELQEYLFEPVKSLGLKARIYGVRYPEHVRQALADAGIEYAGYLPNYQVPAVFSHFRATVHIPRRPYVQMLRGIPTIRPFEALVCGIPLISAEWEDVEGLFTPGEDFLVARNGNEMRHHLKRLLEDEALAERLAIHGRRSILARHTCAHRANELLAIYEELQEPARKVRFRVQVRVLAHGTTQP
jgi:spore maturation protein CgeB